MNFTCSIHVQRCLCSYADARDLLDICLKAHEGARAKLVQNPTTSYDVHVSTRIICLHEMVEKALCACKREAYITGQFVLHV